MEYIIFLFIPTLIIGGILFYKWKQQEKEVEMGYEYTPSDW